MTEPFQVIAIPLISGQECRVTQTELNEWQSLYPAVDVMQELRKMRGWSLANPKQKKTPSGVRRFINTWLSKEQDRGPRRNGQSYPLNRQEALEAHNQAVIARALAREQEQDEAIDGEVSHARH